MLNLTIQALAFKHPSFDPMSLFLTLKEDTYTLFIRALNYHQRNEERMFVLKFSDMESPEWIDDACTFTYGKDDKEYNLHLKTLDSFYPSLKLADDGLEGS